MMKLQVEALSREAFRPFGDVIQCEGARHFPINDGTTERYDDLTTIDAAAGGRAAVSIFRSQPRTFPFRLSLLERHPLGTQAFMPLSGLPYLVVVAEGIEAGRPCGLRAFRAGPLQGVNYFRDTWHHPLIALAETSNFLVIDRVGPGDNCVEHGLDGQNIWLDRPELRLARSNTMDPPPCRMVE